MSTSYMLHNHLNSKRKYNKYLHMFYFISPQTDIRTNTLNDQSIYTYSLLNESRQPKIRLIAVVFQVTNLSGSNLCKVYHKPVYILNRLTICEI